MASSDGDGTTEERGDKTSKPFGVHRRPSNFKVIHGSKRPAPEPAPTPEPAAEPSLEPSSTAEGTSKPAPEPAPSSKAAAAPASTPGTTVKVGVVEEPEPASEGEAGAEAGSEPAAKKHWWDIGGYKPHVPEAQEAEPSETVFEGATEQPEEGYDFWDEDPAERRNRRALERERKQEESKDHTVRVCRIIGIVVAALVVIVIVVFAAFAWNRWWHYSDSNDFQGEWYVEGTATPVTIDSDMIHLSSDVSYSYELDLTAKTIEFSFGPLEGQGHYWFEDNRQRLIIVDGEGYTAVSTFFDDFSRTIAGLFGQGSADQLANEQGVAIFSRTATEPPAEPPAAQSGESAAPSGEESSLADSFAGAEEVEKDTVAIGESALRVAVMSLRFVQVAENVQPSESAASASSQSATSASAVSTSAQPSASAQSATSASAASAQSAASEQSASPSRDREMLSVSDIIAGYPELEDSEDE